MKKTINIIAKSIAVIGVFAAVCVVDGSNHEIAIRLGGTIAFVAGVLIAAATGKETESCK